MRNITGYWSDVSDHEGFEKSSNQEDLLGEAHEALTRFYQKESKRNKPGKQRRQGWI